MNTITLINLALHALLLSAIGWAFVRWCVADARHRAWASLVVLLASVAAPCLIEFQPGLKLTAPLEDAAPAAASSWKPDRRIPAAAIAPARSRITEQPIEPRDQAWSVADFSQWLCIVWLVGASMLALRHAASSIAAWRWRRSLRQLTDEEQATLPSSAACVPLRISPDDGSPCVVGLWRPVIAVPRQTIASWSARQWTWLLRHEGEHLRGCDTLTASLLGWAKALLWWNPFVHALVEQWAQAREEICDAAAVAAEPDPAAYSGFLLDLASHSEPRSPMHLHMAASRPARRLRARMSAMLTRQRVRRNVSAMFKLGAAMIMVGAAIAISCIGLKAEDTPTRTSAPGAQQLAGVAFATGHRQLPAGDDIVIDEVSSTSPNFAVGDRVVVKGRYTLASASDARLSLFLTARNTGRTKVNSEQTTSVKQGSGTFELAHVIRHEGVLHVSFYPSGGGKVIGGVYFGTKAQIDGMGGSSGRTPAKIATLPHTLNITPEIKRAFHEGDAIEIRNVTGTAPKLEVGGTYRVIGVCRQQTLNNASLYLGNTAERGDPAIVPAAGSSLSMPLPTGATEFDITFTLRRPGMVHVTIYDLDKRDKHGNAYAGIYLGDAVLKR